MLKSLYPLFSAAKTAQVLLSPSSCFFRNKHPSQSSSNPTSHFSSETSIKPMWVLIISLQEASSSIFMMQHIQPTGLHNGDLVNSSGRKVVAKNKFREKWEELLVYIPMDSCLVWGRWHISAKIFSLPLILIHQFTFLCCCCFCSFPMYKSIQLNGCFYSFLVASTTGTNKALTRCQAWSTFCTQLQTSSPSIKILF